MAVRTLGDTRPMAQPRRPQGRGLGSPPSSGPNGGPGRTVRPTEGRPFAYHSKDSIKDTSTPGPLHSCSVTPSTPHSITFHFSNKSNENVKGPGPLASRKDLRFPPKGAGATGLGPRGFYCPLLGGGTNPSMREQSPLRAFRDRSRPRGPSYSLPLL